MPNPTTAAEWARGFLASDGFALWVRGEADTGYLEGLLANELDAYAHEPVEAHQAVVRELAEILMAMHARWCKDSGALCESPGYHDLLALPLVVAARTEGRDENI